MRYIIALLLFFCVPAFAIAETIVLESGQQIEGKIVERTDKYITVDVYGVISKYYLDEIASIESSQVRIDFKDVKDLQGWEEESLREVAEKYKNDGKNIVVLKNGIKLSPFRIEQKQGTVILMFRGNKKDANEYERADMIPLNEIETINGMSMASVALALASPLAQQTWDNAIGYMRQGKYNEAITEFSKFIEISPNYAEAYSNRGTAYDEKGNYDQAISDFTKAIELNPSYIIAYFNRGNVSAHKGNDDQAILDYTKAIELDPNYADAYNNRGNTYALKHNHDEAISNFTRAIELDPNYAKAYYSRAVVYYYKQEYNKAWADVHKAEELGAKVDSQLLEKIRKASGREN